MNKNNLFALTSSIVVFLGVCFISSFDSKTIDDRKAYGTQVLSLTKSIKVPDEIQFAGETLKLDRYDLHERYDREINSFTYYHSATLLLIKRANRIFPIIEPILKKNGIPDDLKYLAVIESMLNVRAISPAKAAGLWQFMPSTAKQYGLKVTSEVDERYSIEKSTEAACVYLKAAYGKYGDWASVAESYNAGTERISGEMAKQQATNGLDLWLVEETSRYYFRMLAIKEIFKKPSDYGFILTQNDLYKPMKFNKVDVTVSIPDLADFAKNQGVTYAQLKDFNSWLRDRKLTIDPKDSMGYTLLIPTQESLYYHKNESIEVHNKNWVTE